MIMMLALPIMMLTVVVAMGMGRTMCDDDNDDFCDAAMEVIGAPTTCASGGGDCDDEAFDVNPAQIERCDGIDNECTEGVDEGCDDDGDNYCDAAMEVVGTPAICSLGGGDCADTNDAVHPGNHDNNAKNKGNLHAAGPPPEKIAKKQRKTKENPYKLRVLIPDFLGFPWFSLVFLSFS